MQNPHGRPGDYDSGVSLAYRGGQMDPMTQQEAYTSRCRPPRAHRPAGIRGLNCAAPDTGNMEVLSSYARTMRRSASAYHRYWHWRVLCSHERGTYLLSVGYPDRRPVLLPGG